jgi:hypothetical protein
MFLQDKPAVGDLDRHGPTSCLKRELEYVQQPSYCRMNHCKGTFCDQHRSRTVEWLDVFVIRENQKYEGDPKPWRLGEHEMHGAELGRRHENRLPRGPLVKIVFTGRS